MSRPAPAGLSASGEAGWAALTGRPFAHRGLWSEGAPENSPAAFEAACTAGYGIELDVQLSADGEAVVFHDDDLARMTGGDGRVQQKTAAELAQLHLAGTAEHIPTLREVLALVAGRAPLLVEIKTSPGAEGPLPATVADLLDGYAGPAAVIGFDPFAIGWFAAHRPEVLRGLTSYAYDDDRAHMLTPEQRRALAAFEHAALASPHFILPGQDIVRTEPVQRLRGQGLPALTWTVRSPEDAEALRPHCDNIIFEGFRP